MIKATLDNRAFITEILVRSFDNNASVNYIIKQDQKRRRRIEGLMNYSFNVCYYFGSVYYSEDKKGCALLLIPEQKKNRLRSLFLDIKFAIASMDFFHLKKTLARESKIKALQWKGRTIYLWYIGVDPQSQGKGNGTRLLREVLNAPEMKGRIVLLETSTLQSVDWYGKHGFSLYAHLDLGYTLYFMKKEN